MQDTHAWQYGSPRDARGAFPILLEASSGTSASDLAATATVVTIVSSTSSKRHARVAAIIVCSTVSVLATGIFVFAILKWWKARRRARAREPEIWRNRNVEALDGIGSASNGEIYLPDSPNLGHTSSPSIRISPSPPTIILSPGWPHRSLTRDKDEERRRYGFTRNSRLLDDTPYEDIADYGLAQDVLHEGDEERRCSVSTIEAIAGSAGPSAAPSRTASRSQRHARRSSAKLATDIPTLPLPTIVRRPLPNVPPSQGVLAERYRRSSSRWSWSHRATYHEGETGVHDVEPLPAYSARRSRSRSTSAIRSRSRRSSMHDISERSRHASNALLNTPEYPLELARKVAQAYPREPRTPPPPGYSS